MGFTNLKIAFNHKSKGLSIYFFMLFFTFSLIVSILGYVVSQYLLTKKSNAEMERNLKIEHIQKKNIVKGFIDSQYHYLEAAINNEILIPYIKDQKTYNEQLKNIYLSIIKTRPAIMQLRFIDENGHEKMKVVRNKYKDTPFAIKEKNLQNKSSRYYFKEVSKIKDPNTIWFSKIDLNIEYGKIQVPLVPTLRVAKAIIVDNEFKGMVIINIFAQTLLEKLSSSIFFKIGVLDSKKDYLLHFSDPSKNWSGFFNERGSFSEEYCMVEEFLVNEKSKEKVPFFTKELKDIIPNNKLYLLFTPNENAFKEIRSIQKKYILYFILFTFLISIPISILLSRIPFKYTKKLIDSKHQLLEIIDEHVLYSSSDLNGNITDVSKAVCKLTKYSKDELLGQNHNIFRHPDTPDDAFQSMWSTILGGHTWRGEIKNLDKDHDVFWIDATITPNFDSKGEISGFTAIRKNITDRKIIEALSVTDELTTLYNKRFFNKTFPKEIKRAKRLKTNFVFVILDIDNFKLYNDTYGHKEGDKTLQEVGVLIQRMFKRSYDFAFRIGGEEFAVIFSEKDAEKIAPYIERVRKAIEDLNIIHEKNNDYGVITASIGYRIVESELILKEEEIYSQADKALYIAKERGRNRIINYDDLSDR